MQEITQNEKLLLKEKTVIARLSQTEDLAEKKARIFSRLLTDVALSKQMQSLASRHERRKGVLLGLLGEKAEKGENQEE